MGDDVGLARSLNNTGNIHVDLENYTEALSFYKRALGIRTHMSDSVGVAFLLNNLGLYRGAKQVIPMQPLTIICGHSPYGRV